MTAELLEHSGLNIEETPLEEMNLPVLDTFQYKHKGNEINVSFTCPDSKTSCGRVIRSR